MDYDDWQREWLAIADMRGHCFVRAEGGNVDLFAGARSGMHNGPRCAKCGWATCMHCSHDYDSIPDCDRYKAENTVTPPKFRPGDVVLYGVANERVRIERVVHVATEHAHPSIYRIQFWRSDIGHWSKQDYWASEEGLTATGERS